MGLLSATSFQIDRKNFEIIVFAAFVGLELGILCRSLIIYCLFHAEKMLVFRDSGYFLLAVRFVIMAV